MNGAEAIELAFWVFAVMWATLFVLAMALVVAWHGLLRELGLGPLGAPVPPATPPLPSVGEGEPEILVDPNWSYGRRAP